MKDNKFLIISDLDGTLLNSKSELSNETIEYIKNLKNNGHIFCIATGRPLRGAIEIYNKLQLNTIMLNYNGACICNPSDPNFKTIEMTFSKEIAKKILKFDKIKENITNALIESKNIAYMLHTDIDEKIKKDLYNIFHIDTLKDVKNLNENVDELNDDVNSILLNVKNGKDSFDKLVYWIKQICPTLVVRSWNIPSSGIIIEINSVFANKGTGLKFLSSYYGIDSDRTIAFGDGENDMNMLAKAKYGIAMKNGTNAAKVVAKYISKHTNDDNGVIWEIDYLFKNMKE